MLALLPSVPVPLGPPAKPFAERRVVLARFRPQKRPMPHYHAVNTSGSPGIQIKIEEEDNFRYLLSGEEASSSRPNQAVPNSKKNIAGLPKKTRFGLVPAILACYIKSSSDRKMAQGPSFASVAQKGVPKGAQLNLPSRFAQAK